MTKKKISSTADRPKIWPTTKLREDTFPYKATKPNPLRQLAELNLIQEYVQTWWQLNHLKGGI